MSSPWTKRFLLAVGFPPYSFVCFLLSCEPSVVVPGPLSSLAVGLFWNLGIWTFEPQV